jgi:protein-arginine kinase activator protein McsA
VKKCRACGVRRAVTRIRIHEGDQARQLRLCAECGLERLTARLQAEEVAGAVGGPVLCEPLSALLTRQDRRAA